MEHVLKWMTRAGRETAREEQEKESGRALLEELEEVKRQLACNGRWFEMECRGELIDACIYQREELQARYRHLLLAARRRGLTADPFK